MKNRFSNCCFNFEAVDSHSECDRLNCKGNNSPAFKIYGETPRFLLLLSLPTTVGSILEMYC